MSWVAARWIPTPTCQILEAYKEALTGFSHVYSVAVNTTSLSQSYVLRAASGSRKGKQNPHSQDRVGNEKSLSAWVQLSGQSVVMSFCRLSPIMSNTNFRTVTLELASLSFPRQQGHGVILHIVTILSVPQAYKHLVDSTPVST